MITLIIPAYNENLIIEYTVKKANEFLSKTFKSYEIIVVDDGSTDDMKNTVSNMDIDNLKIVSYNPNMGKGYAVRQGIFASQGDYIFFTDADLAYGIDVIKKGYRKMKRENSDVVIGSRKLSKEGYKNYPFIRLVASKIFSFITGTISGLSYDTQCGFKGFRREAALSIFENCVIDRFAFDFEAMLIAKRMGFKISEIGVSVINHRDSKVNILKDSIKMFRDIIKVRIVTESRIKGHL